MLIHPLGCSVTEHPLKGINVLLFSNSVYEAWNNKHYIPCILCDKTMVFDCVSHEVLLSKLELHKVTGIGLGLTHMTEDSEYP